MERRRLGKTDLDVAVLGLGAAEIGFEKASQETVEKLWNSALDAGLNVIGTAECYEGSEELIGQAVSKRRVASFSPQEYRAQFAAFENRLP